MPDLDTGAIRTIAIVWRHNGASATADAVEATCDEVDRLRAENTALAAALADIAGMREYAPGQWVADAECSNMGTRVCHERWPSYPDEWCQTCVAEVAWCAWKMGALR